MGELDREFAHWGSMRVISIDGSGAIPEVAKGAIVSIGNFDGVHLGHQRLLARTRAHADAAGLQAMAITFDPHPVTLLRPEAAPVPLVWLDREIALLQEVGASLVGVLRTGPWLLELTAREFFDRILCEQLAVRGLVEGPNFAFGHDRTGDVRTLGEWCNQAGIKFEVVDLAVVDGRPISSSLIRQCLREGRVGEAARYLGRPHRIRGSVVLGAPKSNLDRISHDQLGGRRHARPGRRRLRRLGVVRRSGRSLAGRLQRWAQPNLRRSSEQSRGPPDRLRR